MESLPQDAEAVSNGPVTVFVGTGEMPDSDSSSSGNDSSDGRSGSGKSDGSNDSPKLGRKRNKKKPMRPRAAPKQPKKAAGAQTKKKSGKERYVDAAAEESDEEGGVRAPSDDEDDGGEEDKEEEEEIRRGFIVSSDDDSGASSSDSEDSEDSDSGKSGSEDQQRRPRKLRRVAAKEKDELLDDDLALVAEAAEDGLVEVNEKVKRKIKARLTASGAGAGNQGDFLAEDARALGLSAATAAAVAAAAKAEGAGKRGGGAVAADEDAFDADADVPKTTVFDDEYDSEGLDDFIVDGDGGRVAGLAKKRRREDGRGRGGVQGATSEQISQFQDVFGDRAVQAMFGGGGHASLASLYADEPAYAAVGEADDDDEGDEGDEEYVPAGGKAKSAATKKASETAKEAFRAVSAVTRRDASGRAVRPGTHDESLMSPLEKKRQAIAASVEPSLLASYYVQDVDVAIRSKDDAERLQTSLRGRRERIERVKSAFAAAEEGSILASLAQDASATLAGEVEWIVRKMSKDRVRALSDPYSDVTPSMSLLPSEARGNAGTPYAVRAVLSGVLEDGLEPASLWTYRRDEVATAPGMTLAGVWTVLDLDDVWSRIAARRAGVAGAVDKAFGAGMVDAEAHARMRTELLTESALSERALDDVSAYADLLIAGGEAAQGAARKLTGGYEVGEDGAVDQAGAGRKGVAEAISGGTRVDMYRLAQASDMRTILPALFLPAHDLASNVRADSVIHQAQSLGGGAGDTPDTAEGLRSLAFNALDEHFNDEDAVLRAARHVAATDMSREPFLRRTLRESFFDSAHVSTEPTERGKAELDPSHPYFGLHVLRSKAVREFSVLKAHRPESSASRHSSGDLFAEGYHGMVDDEQPGVGWEVADKLTTGMLPEARQARYPGPDNWGLPGGYGSPLVTARLDVLRQNPDMGSHRPKPGESNYGEEYARAVRHEARVGGCTQWLLLARAEKEGLITVKIEPGARWAKDSVRRLLVFSVTPLGVAQMGDGDPTLVELASEADKQRRSAVVSAVEKMLAPEFTAEVRTHLLRMAQDAVSAEFACALRRRVMQAPPMVPAQPLRKRKDKGGEDDGDDGMGAGKEQPTVEPALLPWVRARYRTMVVAVAKQGDRRLTADCAVLLDARGDLIDHAMLPLGNDRRQEALAEFMFTHAPDMVVINTTSGLNKCRDMKRAVLEAAVVYDGLVRKARQNAKKRKELRRMHGAGVVHAKDERVKAEWDATFLPSQLEVSADKWASGKWKFIRPRAPATKVETDRNGVSKTVPDESKSSLPVLCVDDDIAHTFVNSARTRSGGLGEQAPVVQYAVALGRYAADPLSEIAYLWGSRGDTSHPGVAVARESGVASITTDILSPGLHPLQNDVPANMLFAAAERVMTEAVAAVGVDLNSLGGGKRDHLSSTLQFVPGLGPRKAAALMDAMVQRLDGGLAASRAQLLELGLLGERVFRNASPCLRVSPPWSLTGPQWRGTGQSADKAGERMDFNVGKRGRGGRGGDEDFGEGMDIGAYNPLDATRIHPDNYDLAVQFLAEVPKEMAALSDSVRALLGEWGGDWDAAADWPSWDASNASTYSAAARLVLNRLQFRTSAWLASVGLDFTQFRPRPITMALSPENDLPIPVPAAAYATPADGEREPGDFLDQLDLDAFAGVLVGQGKGSLRHILELIKGELRCPFREPRRPTPKPSAAALFRMFTGESTMSLRKGLILNGVVDRVNDARMSLRFDNGVKGSVSARSSDLPRGPDGEPTAPLQSMYKEGAAVTVRVTRIGRDGFYMDCSAETSRVRMAGFPPMDAEADTEAAVRLLEASLKELDIHARRAALENGASSDLVAAAMSGTGPALRAIAHPSFQNVTRKDAESTLDGKPLYAVIFRPSSLGLDHLTMTWKLMDPCVCAHVDLVELEKDSVNPASMGRRLVIDKTYEYSDLDEVLVRYVEPCADVHRKLRNASMFRAAAPAEVEDILKAEKEANSRSTIPYCISPDFQQVGYYRLNYLWKGGRVRHEPVKAVPGGLLWRGQVSRDHKVLIDDFKVRVIRPYNPNKDKEKEAQLAAAKVVSMEKVVPLVPMQVQQLIGAGMGLGGMGQVGYGAPSAGVGAWPQGQYQGQFAGQAYANYGAPSGAAAGPVYGYANQGYLQAQAQAAPSGYAQPIDRYGQGYAQTQTQGQWADVLQEPRRASRWGRSDAPAAHQYNTSQDVRGGGYPQH